MHEQLQAMLTPSQLSTMSRVREALLQDPTTLDKSTTAEESEDGQEG